MAPQKCARPDRAEVNRCLSSLRDATGISFAARPPKLSEPADVAVSRARLLTDNLRFAEAEGLLKECLSESPFSKAAVYELIRCYSLAKNVPAAAAVFDYAFTREIAGDSIYGIMAYGYCVNDMAGSALIMMEMAEARGLLSAPSCDKVMRALRRGGSGYAESRALFSMAQKAGIADDGMFLTLLIHCMKERGLDEALDLIRDHKDIAFPKAYAVLSAGFMAARRREASILLAEEAFALCKADGDIIAHALKAHYILENHEAAWSFYRQALECNISSEKMHRNMARICCHDGKTRRANMVVDEAVKSGHATTSFFHTAITEQMEAGDMAGAARSLNLAHAHGAFTPQETGRLLARFYAHGEYDKAVCLADSLPRGLRMHGDILLRAADALRKCGSRPRAIRLLDSFIASEGPSEAEIIKAKVIKAFCLKETGGRQEALRTLLDLHDSVPEHPLYTPRLACGIIFCWEETGFTAALGTARISLIESQISAHLTEEVSDVSRQDMENALRIIDERRQASRIMISA